MGKKAKQRRQQAAQESKPDPLVFSTIKTASKKRVLFAVGDADYGYTEGKIIRLAQRLKEHTAWDITTLTHDAETFESTMHLRLLYPSSATTMRTSFDFISRPVLQVIGRKKLNGPERMIIACPAISLLRDS